MEPVRTALRNSGFRGQARAVELQQQDHVLGAQSKGPPVRGKRGYFGRLVYSGCPVWGKRSSFALEWGKRGQFCSGMG